MAKKWINSTAAAIKKGTKTKPGSTTFNRVDTADNDSIAGTVQVDKDKVSWWAGYTSKGTANTVGQAKVAVEKLAGKG